MAISCTPADLAAAAKNFQGLPSEQKQWIDTYLLAVIAGGSTDPNTLALAAKCYQCIPPGMIRRVQAYLLCQIASGGGGGPCPQDMQVAWTPTTAKLGEDIGYYIGADIPETDLVFSAATSGSGFQLFLGPTTKTLSFPNLVSIDPLGVSFTGLSVGLATNMTSISAPLLSIIGGAGLLIQGLSSITSLSFPSLTHVLSGITIKLNPLLTTISIPSYNVLNTETFDFSGNALTASTVNAILARLVLNPGYVSGVLDLSGGTNAAPTGQGIVDKATLIGRIPGVTVTTN